VHVLRHTFGQRLWEAGVVEEDRALLLGHAITGMPQHYASAKIARLVEAANKVREMRDRATLLRVVNGRVRRKSRSKQNGLPAFARNPLI
jgi:hypothetical protein